ncbi:nicotinamidase/isochorismatase family protein [Sporolactobacillus inulinus]|uniref:Nicotinamidase/isochorismatase family protein n=1 Tax=Sporolactobacillus inulinus TaxID=2078 RepID=A0A4Y1ZGG2_9BACL|nr:isochorismatase family protein [Sporolactobacillus inulinus]GAY78227.1 nicotinamidase/isochorismatase family protein [Sporolactobacillus inulinus]
MNKDRTALVVIDLQNGIVNSQHAPYTGAQVVEKTTKLVNTFTKNGAFVALVRVSSFDGKDWFVPQTIQVILRIPLPKSPSPPFSPSHSPQPLRL